LRRDIPLTYFGPAPSSVQKELVGPYQLLKSGTIDLDAGTIELPLYRGELTDGRNVWYVLTDTTDAGNGVALGLNVSSKLAFGDTGKGARSATLGGDGTLTFDSGTVDFSPERVSIAADGDGGTVTLSLTTGFSFSKPVLYLSLDANVDVAAALEAATLAPALSDIRVGGDDGAFSAVERLFAISNGPTGTENPQRQGFNSALSDRRGPLNVLGGIPTVATDYSPLWDVNIGTWSADAVAKGYTSRVIEEFQILGLVEQGWITGPGGAAFGSTGIIVNCPIVFRFL